MENLANNLSLGLLQSRAATIASFIDTKAGDFPLISGMPLAVGQGVLWQYANHDFIIYYGSSRRRFPSMIQMKKGSPSNLWLRSLEEALEFIRITEAIRQKTIYPRVLFGRMPTTLFKPIQ